MSRTLRFLAAIALLALGSGCMSIYKIPPGAPAASMRVAPGVQPWICANGPAQILPTGKDGRAQIPAGQPITIGASFYSSDGYMNYSCRTSVSITPELGARYYQDWESEAERCRALIYRETADARVGLDFEPSVGSGGAGCTK